ncbi:alcohol dehydrogenase catalytic domain-containing protein [Streptosporangium roseum]|uniref:alcohol dehydrogenase catalytic domain-containing protein n=1 Tax=Streptosporangium roseum TaxID=2001 RepID=UPI003D9E5643
MRAIQIIRTGGPEVLTEVELPDPEPAPGHLLVEVEAAGVNFADTARVAGAYLPPELPFVPGGEVVGRTADGRRVMGLAQRGYASRAVVDGEDALSDARRAHEDMLARRTTGKIILRP